jgi:hypothetical protein
MRLSEDRIRPQLHTANAISSRKRLFTLTQNLLLFGVIFPTSFCCVMKSALQRLRQSFSPSTSLQR